MSKLSLPILTPLVTSTSATVEAALSFPNHATPALILHSVDHSTAQVMVDDGAEDGAGMMWILLTTVASTLSGNYPLASSAAVTSARAASVSASEDIKTMDTMDDETDDAQDCLIEDNLVYVI